MIDLLINMTEVFKLARNCQNDRLSVAISVTSTLQDTKRDQSYNTRRSAVVVVTTYITTITFIHSFILFFKKS